jgi:hypothetical protein
MLLLPLLLLPTTAAHLPAVSPPADLPRTCRPCRRFPAAHGSPSSLSLAGTEGQAAAMDSAYLKSAVGSVLAKGIAETVVARPSDPIDYLAQFLLKSVSDEKEDKALKVQQKAATERQAAIDVKTAADAEAAAAKEEAMGMQKEKEDKRLDSLLENASSTEEVFSAVLSYARARTGASGYVMLTDLPEKVMPYVPPPPPPPPAEGEEGYEEWKAEQEAKAAAEAEAPPPEEGEPAEPPPKFAPSELEYVAATSSDEALLIGKKLPKPPAPPEEGDDTPPPPTGVGEGVSFAAISEYYAGTSKVYHVPNAVTNRSVKFWYLPRIGAYACAPFADFEGDVCGCLGFDTLGLERPFTDAELELLASLAEQTGSYLQKIESGLCEQHHAQVMALKELYPKDAESGAYPAAPPAEEGADPIETAKAAVAVPQPVLAGLTADALKFTETRRRLLPALLLVIKGVLALLSPAMAEELTAATWDGVKEGISTGELIWGAELFAAVGAFDVFAGAGEVEGASGWAAAEALLGELATAPEEGDGTAPEAALTAPETETVLGKLMYDWLKATVELHKLKAEKDAADAAAAAAEAEGGGEPAAEEAQE